MEQYKLDKQYLCNIIPHQYKSFLESIEARECKDGYFYLPYSDRSYKCLPLLPQIISSKTQAISFFSGCGGLDIGTQLAGVKVISTLDFEPITVETMRLNKFFAHAEHRLADIRDINATDYLSIIKRNNPEKLIVVGGPPCQPFSKAGYWITNNKRKGVNDERNMVGEYLRVIGEIRPDAFLLENVESILHPTNKEVVDFIENEITKMGYKFHRYLADATHFGVPQKRKRVLFLASKNGIKGSPQELSQSDINKVNVLDWIAKFDTFAYEEAEESTKGKTYDYELSEVPPGHNYIALSARDNYPNPKFIANKRYWNFLLKLHPLLPSWTIAAQPGPWVGPFHWNNRRLRVSEIAGIQTFPEDYLFAGNRRTIQKQIGNAVPCILAKHFVNHLISQL